MLEHKIIEQMETPRSYRCQVCVCGGGVAGIAAALAAARAGAEVILVEKGFLLGGLATAGLVTIYLPICDGVGNKVSGGLAEELLMLSVEYGAEEDIPAVWNSDSSVAERRSAKRCQAQFNAQLFAISAEQLLCKAGVKILYGASVVAVHSCGDRITDIIIEGKSGREAICVTRSVVDATGDADVCKLAGAQTRTFAEGNKLAAWYYGCGAQKYKLYMCGVHTANDLENADTHIQVDRRFSGLDTEELSEQNQLAHAFILKDVLSRRAQIPDLLPVTVGTIPAVRKTRRLSGACTLELPAEYAYYTDSVGVFSDWRKRGPVYELPFSALYGHEVKNLITAGRCISTDDDMWEVTRVIPVCAVSGEAAGAAAAMSDDFGAMDVALLQKYLQRNGVTLHWDTK